MAKAVHTRQVHTDPTFGEILGQLLYEQERSAAWLARKLKVDSSTVTKWLNEGVRPNSLDLCVTITNVLGVQESEQRNSLFRAAGYTYYQPTNSTVTELDKFWHTKLLIEKIDELELNQKKLEERILRLETMKGGGEP